MNKINTFTSTGNKLLRHPDIIKKIRSGFGVPNSIQVAPTSRCQLKCSFCSNVNRPKHEDLDFADLMTCLLNLRNLGAKTVEITGGGDPTMYEAVEDIIFESHDIGYKIGMITNGVQLKEKIGQNFLNLLSWVRISMNCLDYVKDIDIPEIKGTLGFSYVMNDKTTPEVLERLHEYVRANNVEYVRIVPNCQVSDEEQEKNNKELSELVKGWGSPYFYQAKVFDQPDRCYWGYMKPFILHDGYVYPCSSVVLNESAGRSFHDKFRWVKMEDLPSIYNKPMDSFPTDNCNHCVFANQNNMVRELMEPCEMEDFI